MSASASPARPRRASPPVKKYARGILELKDGVPSVEHLTAEEVLRLGTECLACEFACTFHGNKAITIDVPVAGLPEYLAKRGLA